MRCESVGAEKPGSNHWLQNVAIQRIFDDDTFSYMLAVIGIVWVLQNHTFLALTDYLVEKQSNKTTASLNLPVGRIVST